MSKFVIIPDSTADLPRELRERFNVPAIVSGSVTLPDGHSVDVTCDWDCISEEDFYQQLKKFPFQTGAPSPDKFALVFEKYLAQGYDVLSISISGGLSSTYQYALAAAEELKAKYPDNKVVCVDSRRYSTAELLLIVYANKLQEEGKNIDEAFMELEEIKHHLHQAGPMDDLMYLARAKRISNTKAVMGTLIGINPIGEINSDGITKVLCKVKGSKKALMVCTEYINRTIENPHDQIIVIGNSNRKEKAKMFAEMIKEKIGPKEIIFTDVGLSCAPNIGPGLCAAYYYGKRVTDDLAEEQKIYEDIIENM